jgi:WD40-like Beta Propeller Repeat
MSAIAIDTMGNRFRAATLSTLLLVCALAVCALASSASGATLRPLVREVLLPEEESASAIAINQTTHHFYVQSTGAHPGIYNFESNGDPDPLLPVLPGSSTLDGGSLAVDNSGGAHEGYLYAASSGGTGLIQQFNPSGSETAVQITLSSIPAAGAPQEGGLPPVVNNGFFSPHNIAVAPSGNVVFESQGQLDEFKPEGVFAAQFKSPVEVSGMAIDGAGDLYLSGNKSGFGTGLFKTNSRGECGPSGCEPIAEFGESLSGRVADVAVNESTGHLFLAGTDEEQKSKFSEFDNAATPLGTTYPGLPPEATGELIINGIVTDEAGDDVIIPVNAHPELGAVQIYGPVEVVPDVELEPVSGATESSIVLHGKVGAASVSGTTCAFQYVAAASFGANGFKGAAEAPCEPAGPFSGSTLESVEAHVSGLIGGTTYRYRLVGSNGNGSNPTAAANFSTEGPTVTATETVEVSTTGATLEAKVDPNGEASVYRFQYVSQADFEASGYADAIDAPPGGAQIGAGTEAVPVAQEIDGLAPGTEYRFRVVAESIVAETVEWTTTGPDQVFKTFSPTPAGLPDGRAYEQVSPTQKNGANIQGEENAVRASIDGNRLTFASFAGIPGGTGQQQFASYLASRAANGSGWSTQGMLPPASAGSIATILGWDEELNNVYDFASEPLIPNTQLLDRSSADGSLSTVALLEEASTGGTFNYAGASATGGVVLFEGADGGILPGDLPGKQNVYVYDREARRLVLAGVLNPTTPGGEPAVPPGGVMGGPYDWFNTNNPSAVGGAADGYFTQEQRAISGDGRRIVFTAGGTGQLYVRENPLAEQSAMSGEECTEAAKACTVRVSAPATGVTDPGTPAAFVGAGGADGDGSLVYFLDTGKLTSDSTAGKGYDLYRYDLDDHTLTDLTVDSADPKGAQVAGVLGVSEDGEDVYFAAVGALAPGATKAPEGDENIYAIHGGSAEFIARVSGDSEVAGEGLNWVPVAHEGSGNGVFHKSRVSADGKTLLFTSSRNLTSFESHGQAELYLHRQGEPTLRCISCNPTGERPQGGAGLQEIPFPGFRPNRDYGFSTRNLSENGRRVIFDTSDQLVAADTDHANDVYEWEQKGEGSCASEEEAGGCVFLLSGGIKGASYFGDADLEGNDAFFFTEQQLVAQDRDQLVDAYDARIGGGIGQQNETPQVPCEGEACAGPAASPPDPAAAGTSTHVGPGNPTPPPTCKKGQVRRNGKCVKKPAKKKKSKKHQGKHNGKSQKSGAKGAKGGSGK